MFDESGPLTGGDNGRTELLVYPDLQALDLSQVSFLSLLQPPPLSILLLDELHLSGKTTGREGGREIALW